MRKWNAIWLGCAAILCSSSEAGALDIIACGDSVPRGRIGDLVTDLDCPSPGPGELENGVTIERGGALRMNGHLVRGGFAAIRCEGSCIIEGPGEVSGNPDQRFGIVGRRRMILRDVHVHDLPEPATDGIQVLPGRLEATDVVVERVGQTGVQAGKLIAERLRVAESFRGIEVRSVTAVDVVIEDNGTGAHVTGRATATNLVVRNNTTNGLLARAVRLGNIRLALSLFAISVRRDQTVDHQAQQCGRHGRDRKPFHHPHPGWPRLVWLAPFAPYLSIVP